MRKSSFFTVPFMFKNTKVLIQCFYTNEQEEELHCRDKIMRLKLGGVSPGAFFRVDTS